MAEIDLKNVYLNFQKPIAITSQIRANVSRIHMEFPDNVRAIVYKHKEKIGDVEGECYYLLSNTRPTITPRTSSIQYRQSSGQSVIFDTTQSVYDDEIFSHYSDDTYFSNTSTIGSSTQNLYINSYSSYVRTSPNSSSTWNGYNGIDYIPCVCGNPTTNPTTTLFYIGMNPNSVKINDWLTYFTTNTQHSSYTLLDGWSSWCDPELSTMATIRDYHNHLNNCEELEENKFVDMHPFWGNIYITEKLDEAQTYLNDGTPPSDAKINEVDEHGAPIPTPPEPTPDPQRGDNDDMDNQNNTTISEENSYLALGYVNHYYCTKAECELFFNWFWRDMYTAMVDDIGSLVYNAFTGAYGNLAQYFLSCRKFNIDMSTFFNLDNSNPQIVLGRYDTRVHPTAIVTNEKENMIPVGSFDTGKLLSYADHTLEGYKPTKGAFLDYAPFTTLSLYLPFIGIVPLETNQIMGRYLSVKASVDIVAGTIMYNVFVVDGQKQTLISTYEGNCSVEIPIALDNAFNNASNLFSNAVNATIGVMGKNPMALAELGNSIYSQPVSTSSASTGNVTYHNPCKCAIIIQQTDANSFTLQSLRKGYLWREVEWLSRLVGDGLTIIKEPEIINWNSNEPTPTTEDIEEIYSLMESGIEL